MALRFAGLIVGCGLIASCGRISFEDLVPREDAGGLDASNDADVRDGRVPLDGRVRDSAATDARLEEDGGGTLGDFGEPMSIDTVNSGSVDWAPSLSADGLTLYFESGRGGGAGGADIWVSTREDLASSFGSPRNLSEVNSSGLDASPSISRDGLRLYFDRRTTSSADIHVATRTSTTSDFDPPMPIATLAEDGRDEFGPHESGDGLTLYFNIGGNMAFATRASIAEPYVFNDDYIDEVNTTADQGWPSVPANELEIYFQRPGDIFVARRRSREQPFGTPILVPELDAPGGSSGDPSISYDGRLIVFGSDRPDGDGNFDIWIASREIVTAQP